MNKRLLNNIALSGLSLVSRAGDVESTIRVVKVSHYRLTKAIKSVGSSRQ